MDSPQSMGTNRTGIDMSPEGAEQMTEATREFPPTSSGSQVDLAQFACRILPRQIRSAPCRSPVQ